MTESQYIYDYDFEVVVLALDIPLSLKNVFCVGLLFLVWKMFHKLYNELYQ
jgi:hypothetical protein